MEWERNGGLGERVWPTRPGSSAKVFLFVRLRMFQHKSVHSKLSPGPTIVLITPHSGWAFHPDENWKIPAKDQLFSNSQGTRVIDGSFSLPPRCSGVLETRPC